MNFPQSIRAGDSLKWTESLAGYPASQGWALKLRLVWPGGPGININVSPEADDFSVSLSAADTAAWDAGLPTLVAWVEKSGERITLATQQIQILPNLAIANDFDGRSQAVKALADARAALADYVAGKKVHVEEYDIAGRRVKFRNAKDIADLISHYETEVAKENAARAILQGQSPGRVLIKM